jgi:hypothetical protein
MGPRSEWLGEEINCRAVLNRNGAALLTVLSQTCTRALARSRIENAFTQPERFRSGFNIFVDVDVIDRALQAHAKRLFQLNPRCFARQGWLGVRGQ